MRSVRFESFGDPLAVLRMEDLAEPAPAPDGVLVRLRVRPINPSDLLIVRGRYGVLPQLPATVGLEGAGEIVSVGSGVRGLKTGQRVIPIGLSGTWQELVLASPAQLIVAPDTLDERSAAQFVVNPLSAWIMTVEELALGKDEWLVQTGATSTIGRIVLQIARVRGFRTINVVRRAEQIDELSALGGDVVVLEEDAAKAIREAGASKAIDAVGGETGAKVFGALAPGGTMITYGALAMQPTVLDSVRLIYSSPTLKGFWLNHWRRTTPDPVRTRVIAEALQALASGAVVPPVEAEYPLEDFAAGIGHTKRPGRRGKVLLTG